MSQREFPDAPIVGVGAVIVQENRVLLIRRGQEPLKGRWSLPGGAVELGETLDDAIRREVAEETGLSVEVVQRLGVFDKIVLEDGVSDHSNAENQTRRVRYHYVLIDFLCRPLGGTLACAGDAAEARWIPREEISPHNSLELDPSTVSVIESGFCAAELQPS